MYKDKKLLILILTITSSLIINIDISSVEFMLPGIIVELNGNLNQAKWLITGYIIGIISLSVSAGYVADVLSRKWIYIFGLFSFAATSYFITLVIDINNVIIFRILQGCSAGIVGSISISYIISTFPNEEKSKSFGLIAASVGIGYFIGPLSGGWLLDNFGWKWIFLINVPIFLFLTVLAIVKLPEIEVESDEKIGFKELDFYGMIALSTATICLSLMFEYNNIHLYVLMLILLIFFISIYIIHNSNITRKIPIIDIYLIIYNKRFIVANISSFISFVGAYIIAFIIPFIIISMPLKITISQIGILLGTFPTGFLIGSLLGAYLQYKNDVHKLFLASVIIIISSLPLFYLFEAKNIFEIGIITFIIGIGRGIWIAPYNSYVTSIIPIYRMSTVGGILTLTRNFGILVGTLISGHYTEKYFTNKNIDLINTIKIIDNYENLFSKLILIVLFLYIISSGLSFYLIKLEKHKKLFK